MVHGSRIGRAGVALVAAYALALQALLASFGVGAAVVRHQLAGIAICTSSADRSAPAAPADHDRTACCILCSAPAPGPIGPIGVVAGVPDAGPSLRLMTPDGAPRLGMIAWLPAGARAPPLRV